MHDLVLAFAPRIHKKMKKRKAGTKLAPMNTSAWLFIGGVSACAICVRCYNVTRQSEVYNNVTAQTLIRPIPFSLTVYSIESDWDAFSNI